MDGQDEQDFSFLSLSCLSCLSMFTTLVPGKAFVPQLSTSEVDGSPSSITMAFLKTWGSREAAKPPKLVPGYCGVGDFPGSGSAWQVQSATEANGNSSYQLNGPNGNWSYRFPMSGGRRKHGTFRSAFLRFTRQLRGLQKAVGEMG